MEMILKHSVFQSDQTLHAKVKNILTGVLRFSQGSDVIEEYADCIDGRGGIIEGKTTEETKWQLRSFLIFIRVQVHKDLSYVKRSSKNKEKIREELSLKGDGYKSIAEKFFEEGIDSDFLAKESIFDQELETEFGIKSAIKRKVMKNWMAEFEAEPVQLCTI